MSNSLRLLFSKRSLMSLLACSAVACGAPAIADEAAPGLQASWQSYDVNFPYMGTTTYYSCTGLEDRLEQILKDLGARSDVRVTASGCAGNDVSRFLSTRIRASLPVETAGAEQFTVVPREVALMTNTPGRVGSGDCELLEQVRDRLLPQLKLKPAGDDLVCIPGQSAIGARHLQVSALIPQTPNKLPK